MQLVIFHVGYQARSENRRQIFDETILDGEYSNIADEDSDRSLQDGQQAPGHGTSGGSTYSVVCLHKI